MMKNFNKKIKIGAYSKNIHYTQYKQRYVLNILYWLTVKGEGMGVGQGYENVLKKKANVYEVDKNRSI